MARDNPKEKRAAAAPAKAAPAAPVAPAPAAKPARGVKGVPAAPVEEVKPVEKKKEKRSQKEKPKSKKKHTKVQVWKLYNAKGGKLERKNQPCPRCGPGTFLAVYKNRKYCGKCGFAEIQK